MKEITLDTGGKIVEVVEASEEEMHLEAAKSGMLSGLTDFKVANINIGMPVAGLVIAGINDALSGILGGLVGGIGGRYAAMIPGIIGLYLLNTKQVKRWLGSGAVDAGNIVIIADLATDNLFNIRAKMASLVGGVKL
ncbi:MAG: hypothetical protein KKD44_27630, partial [Proteobacteria bacterium]|nr:hypothetical protein [Pseudomonadota bacterium]